jgi:hypothetical protein
MPVQPKPKQDIPPVDGMRVVPGTYTARVIYGPYRDSTTMLVKPDPRVQVDAAGLAQWEAASWETQNLVNALTASMDKLRDAQARLDVVDPLVMDQLKDTVALKRYNDQKAVVRKTIDSLQRKMMPGAEVQGIYEDPAQLMVQLQSQIFYLDPAFGTPNPPSGAPPSTYGLYRKNFKAGADEFNRSVEAFERGPWKDFEGIVQGLNLQLLKPLGQ